MLEKLFFQACITTQKIIFPLFQLHPLTTTGLAPVAILIVLNVRICRGIHFLHQRRTSRNRKVGANPLLVFVI